MVHEAAPGIAFGPEGTDNNRTRYRQDSWGGAVLFILGITSGFRSTVASEQSLQNPKHVGSLLFSTQSLSGTVCLIFPEIPLRCRRASGSCSLHPRRYDRREL